LFSGVDDFRKAAVFYDLHMAQGSPRDEIEFNAAAQRSGSRCRSTVL